MADGQIDTKAVETALAEFKDPETGRDIIQLEQVHDLKLDGDRLSVTLGLTTWSAPLYDLTVAALSDHLRARFPTLTVAVDRAVHERAAEKIGQVGLTAKSVVAVGAGKGGVGKSCVSSYLAYGLLRAGCKVGLLDADVYGPSIPHLVGATFDNEPDGQQIQPVVADGLKVMSMGFFVPVDQAVMWRGPMLHGAITQLLRDTAWGDLDYLLIDMPPGTGDVALTLSQLLPLSGAVIVCTPQDVALLDAVKAVNMCRTIKTEVLGMIENMSFFLCPDCNARHEVFGCGGAKQKAAELDIPFLGEVPLDVQLRVLADRGRVADALDHPPVKPHIEAICLNLAKSLAESHRSRPATPSLTVLE